MGQRTFGKVFREARHKADVTLGQVARKLELSISYISDIEHDRRAPFQPAAILAASELFGCDPAPLLASAASTRKSVTIAVYGREQAALATGLARTMERLSPADIAEIERIFDRADRKAGSDE